MPPSRTAHLRLRLVPFQTMFHISNYVSNIPPARSAIAHLFSRHDRVAWIHDHRVVRTAPSQSPLCRRNRVPTSPASTPLAPSDAPRRAIPPTGTAARSMAPLPPESWSAASNEPTHKIPAAARQPDSLRPPPPAACAKLYRSRSHCEPLRHETAALETRSASARVHAWLGRP